MLSSYKFAKGVERKLLFDGRCDFLFLTIVFEFSSEPGFWPFYDDDMSLFCYEYNLPNLAPLLLVVPINLRPHVASSMALFHEAHSGIFYLNKS